MSRRVVCLLLTLLTVVAFGGSVKNGYVDFDDDQYVTDNPKVSAGLTREGVLWAIGSTDHAANWHPLTWLSHMLDVELFGLSPGAHHATSLVLHLSAVLVLFIVLSDVTGSTVSAALVAALFAVHPLRVESVAWVSERKDVLSVLFGMLVVLAWSRYVRSPSVARYLSVVFALAAGLMAKPMLVTMPLLLLLLDAWPFGRWRRFPAGRLVAEKVPLLCLSAASAWLTLVAQSSHWRVGPTHEVAPAVSLAAVPVSVCRYLLMTLWPQRLAVLYPFPSGGYAGALVLGAAALVAGLTLGAISQFRRRPFLAVGWAWYLIALLPVVGIVRVGRQAAADRYTYLPHAGLLLAIVWGVWSVAKEVPGVRRSLAWLAAVPVLVFVLCSQRQTATWRDSISLFEHALSVTRDNALSHLNLGQALERIGRRQEAIRHLEQALRLEPDSHLAQFNLGVAYGNMGQQVRAEAAYREALRLWPGFAEARYNLGTLLMRTYRYREAEAELAEAIRLRPAFAAAYQNLGVILMNQGKHDQARDLFERTLALDPTSETARRNLAGLPPRGSRSAPQAR